MQRFFVKMIQPKGGERWRRSDAHANHPLFMDHPHR